MALFAPKTPPVRVNDPFAVIPLKPDNVELKQDSRGRIHLRLHAPLTGMRRWLSTHLGYDYHKRVELDETGTLYYGLVDGSHSLRAITDALVEKTGTPRADMERFVILFTKQLMTANLVVLKVPPEAQVRGTP